MGATRSLGTLKVFLNGDSTSLDRALVRARRGVSGFAAGIGSQLKALMPALSFSAAVYGVGRMVNSLHDVAKSADKLKISTDTFQKWSFAADRTGTSIDTVSGAMMRLNKYIGAAGRNSKGTASGVLGELGLQFEDLKNMSPEAQFDKVNAALAKVDDANVRASLSAAIYGRNAQSLSVFLEKYIDLGKEAERVGIVNPEAAKSAAAIDEALANAKQSIFSIVANSGLLDFLAKAAEAAGNIANGIKAGGNPTPQLTLKDALSGINLDFQKYKFGRQIGTNDSDILDAIYKKAGIRSSLWEDMRDSGGWVAIKNERSRRKAVADYNEQFENNKYDQLKKLGFYRANGTVRNSVDMPGNTPIALSDSPSPKQKSAVDPFLKLQGYGFAGGSGLESILGTLKSTMSVHGYGKESPSLASLASQGSVEAYRLVASQSQALAAPMKQTAENTRAIMRAAESIDSKMDDIDFSSMEFADF